MLTRALKSVIGLKTALSEDQLRGRSRKWPICPVAIPEFSAEVRMNRVTLSQQNQSHLYISYLFSEDY